MNAIQIFKKGLSSSFRNPISIFATLMILIVPLSYPLLWLHAFWDPYANVGSLPVAFVNEDSGVYGAGIEQQLHSSTDVKWSFPSRPDADAGLEAKTYFAEFIIPEDFSANIEAGQTAGIEVYVDSKNNATATLIIGQIEKQLKTQISSQITANAALKITGNQEVAAFIANPVDIVQTDLNPVANMGTGFAPYFSSLALWIGALLTSMVARPRLDKSKFPGAKPVNLVIGRYLLYAFFGIVQAALLVGVIFLLHISVQNSLLTFIALMVSSLASVAIVSTLITIFGMLGQMFSMLLLLFQLTASGGTYPTELTGGNMFMTLHPFVPFTYSINALRDAISNARVDWSILWRPLGIQLLVVIGCLAVCVAVSAIGTKKENSNEITEVQA